jgi:hypothetical protein
MRRMCLQCGDKPARRLRVARKLGAYFCSTVCATRWAVVEANESYAWCGKHCWYDFYEGCDDCAAAESAGG